jgi:hypothetical protein
MDSSIYFDKANGDSMQTRNEIVALRERIDQAFLFEEIVGSSTALRRVLSSVLKVAPTDSTVLITGETGTGKELPFYPLWLIVLACGDPTAQRTYPGGIWLISWSTQPW